MFFDHNGIILETIKESYPKNVQKQTEIISEEKISKQFPDK